MRGWLMGAFVFLGLQGCAHRAEYVPHWVFEARPTAGEVRVLPVIALTAPHAVDFATFVPGRGEVPWGREDVRKERTRQLNELPERVGKALPGAVNGKLGTDWEGQFRWGRFPVGGHERVRAGLLGRGAIDPALSDVARRISADATLFSWVASVDGTPLTAAGFPGMMIDTPIGPVFVDHGDEPYLVDVAVGMALVASDGEVVLRYSDSFQTILSAHCTPDMAARDLAQGLAAEVVKVWAIESRLAAL